MRNSIQKNINAGILTIPNAAELLSVSHIVIRNLVRLAIADPPCYFPVLIADSAPNSKVREYRIPAGPFYDYCVKNRIPICPPLATAAANYNNKFLPQPAIDSGPIYATADGTPVAFTPSAPPPVDEMTPYISTQPTPLRPAALSALPIELSTGKKAE